ncbi:MAG: hypothetical protein H8D45_26760 [Bacteroidetes bacterium]|nr:hypothetical protein [Bacteroidota bacterium]
MKSTSGWIIGSNGTNESGFNAFPYGNYRYINHQFANVGFSTGFWTYSEHYIYNTKATVKIFGLL